MVLVVKVDEVLLEMLAELVVRGLGVRVEQEAGMALGLFNPSAGTTHVLS